MDYRQSLKMRKIFLFIAGGFLILVFLFPRLYVVFLTAVFIFMMLSLGVTYLYFRCPKCGEGLNGRYFRIPQHCQHCGEKLDAKK